MFYLAGASAKDRATKSVGVKLGYRRLGVRFKLSLTRELCNLPSCEHETRNDGNPSSMRAPPSGFLINR